MNEYTHEHEGHNGGYPHRHKVPEDVRSDLRTMLPRVEHQITLTPAERGAVKRLRELTEERPWYDDGDTPLWARLER